MLYSSDTTPIPSHSLHLAVSELLSQASDDDLQNRAASGRSGEVVDSWQQSIEKMACLVVVVVVMIARGGVHLENTRYVPQVGEWKRLGLRCKMWDYTSLGEADERYMGRECVVVGVTQQGHVFCRKQRSTNQKGVGRFSSNNAILLTAETKGMFIKQLQCENVNRMLTWRIDCYYLSYPDTDSLSCCFLDFCISLFVFRESLECHDSCLG